MKVEAKKPTLTLDQNTHSLNSKRILASADPEQMKLQDGMLRSLSPKEQELNFVRNHTASQFKNNIAQAEDDVVVGAPLEEDGGDIYQVKYPTMPTQVEPLTPN